MAPHPTHRPDRLTRNECGRGDVSQPKARDRGHVKPRAGEPFKVLDLFYDGRKVFHEAKGYACVWVEGKTRKVHVLEWERHHGPKPVGFEIHHVDENKGNWEISNLVLMTNSDHQRVHAGWVKDGDKWVAKPCTACGAVLPLSDFYPRKGYTPSAKCKPCHSVSARQWVADNREKRRKSSLDYYYRRKANG